MKSVLEKALQRTLSDTLDVLMANRIQYALIGGLAASIRGRMRVTEDIDLVLDCNVNEALSLLNGLDETLLEPLFSNVEQVVRRSFILPLQHRETGITIDLAIGISGFEQQTIRRATIVKIASKNLRVATAEDLVLMKILAGRPQDDQDINGILDVQKEQFDWHYCSVVGQQLQDALGMDIAVRVALLKLREL